MIEKIKQLPETLQEMFQKHLLMIENNGNLLSAERVRVQTEEVEDQIDLILSHVND